MKKILSIILIFGLPFISLSQVTIQVGSVGITHISGGINVNLPVTTNQVSGYLSHSYNIVNNIINLSVCYWYNDNTTTTQLENNIEIPLTDNGFDYEIITRLYLSSSQTTCDATSDSAVSIVVFPYLSTIQFNTEDDEIVLFPNPTEGIMSYDKNKFKTNKINVFDSQGKYIKELSKTNLNISDLNNGIYFIAFETEKGYFTRKIILKK